MKQWRGVHGLTAFAALAWTASQGLSAAVIHAGSDAACDAGTLGEAVTMAAATPEADEIRINNGEGTLYENTALVLTDFGTGAKGALTLVGAFDDCSDDTPSSTSSTRIGGTAGSPVMTVNTVGATSVVTFRRVQLRDSGTNGLVISGNSTVTMDAASSLYNGASGIRITGSSAWLDLINGSRVTDNVTAGYGGGIFCQNATVNLISGSVSYNSAASGGGGGVYASNCNLEVDQRGYITSNTAIDGGGIYADQASSITITGKPQGSATIRSNTATDDGGAIYAKSAGTSVVVTNVDFLGNEAVSRGGALFMDDGALLIMNATEANCSWLHGSPTDATRCSTMWSNSTSPGGLGVALYAGSGSTSYLGRTYFEGNDGGDSLIHVDGAGTEVYLEGLKIWSNAVRYLQAVQNDAFLSSAFVSAAHNQYDASGTLTDADVLVIAGGGVVEMYSSVYQGGSFLATGGLSGRCLMASISTPVLDNVDHFTLTSDPGFVDPAGGNLRLKPNSPAVDYCDDSAYTGFWDDIDMQPRGIDLAGNANGSPGVSGGLFDLGFDELADLIFSDRFEN